MSKSLSEKYYEYGGIWLHATDRIAHNWHVKSEILVPPVDMFHLQFIIFRHLGFEAFMDGVGK